MERVLQMNSPEDFNWQLRKIPNWRGGTSIMIEIVGAEGCVSYGDSVKQAKEGLYEALLVWIRHFGEYALPETREGAQIVFLEPPMTDEEYQYINTELKKLT
ncbi:HicB family protein [Halalkalibacter urbisdiaboli]|uniref:HicB family protein n=1 Tax=Halalkalibacter urbisdiaboli TaxID=1960589 RepID=UPI000B4450B4|nr:HicB family protein [Halalkalibacter urbisdiaboli]